MMNVTEIKSTTTSFVTLMDELAAIMEGECIYCLKGLAHPAHSRCSRYSKMQLKYQLTDLKVA